MTINNIFANIPKDLPEELFTDLLQLRLLKVERIVSKGHVTPPGEWYDQDRNEWILLLQGHAKIRLFDDQIIRLNKGDYYYLPAHLKHRVEWTDPDNETIWLAIHFPDH